MVVRGFFYIEAVAHLLERGQRTLTVELEPFEIYYLSCGEFSELREVFVIPSIILYEYTDDTCLTLIHYRAEELTVVARDRT